MSEVKGTLLAIILAISIFAVVYAVLTVTIRSNSESVAERMNESVTSAPDPSLLTKPETSFAYHF